VLSRTQQAFGASPVATAGGASTARPQVHVVGRVRHPGVVLLPAGSRVEDAVRAAGGFAAGADQGAVNLARPVVDGEQIRIPAPGEAVAPPAAAPGSGGVTGTAPTAGAKISLNAADVSALDALPGVGQVLAGRIVAWRQEHGRFTSVEELGEVSGIGEKLLAQLTPLVTL
jgi:competence protein ComEA